MRRVSIGAVIAVIAAFVVAHPSGQSRTFSVIRATSANINALRDWDTRVDQMARAGDLRQIGRAHV